MALGTGDIGRGDAAPETTDSRQDGVERAVEFIAYPSRHKDGSVTHSDEAILGYDPADIPPIEAPSAEAVDARVAAVADDLATVGRKPRTADGTEVEPVEPASGDEAPFGHPVTPGQGSDEPAPVEPPVVAGN